MNNTKNKCFKEVKYLFLLSDPSTTRSMCCLLSLGWCFRLACDGLQIVERLRYLIILDVY